MNFSCHTHPLPPGQVLLTSAQLGDDPAVLPPDTAAWLTDRQRPPAHFASHAASHNASARDAVRGVGDPDVVQGCDDVVADEGAGRRDVA